MRAVAGAAVDVAVVGGGIVGTATAAYLAQAGRRVLLVESVGIAAAASGRNSGVVQQPFDPVLGALYRDSLPLLRALEEADPERFRLPPEPAGLLYVAESEAAVRDLAQALASSHPELQPACLSGTELVALEPALAPDLAACRLSIGYPVGPAGVTHAFAARARGLGAEAAVGEAALVEVRHGRATGVRVGGTFRPAATVVVAAGPWSPELVDPSGAWRPIRSLWGAVVEVELAAPPRHVLEELEIDTTIEPGAVEPAGGAAEAAATEARAARPAEVPISFSLVSADGRSTIGSTFLDHEPDDAALVAALVRRASRFVPSVADGRIVGSRRCGRPLSLDGRPLLGPVPGTDDLYLAAGHGPWGISTGAGSARLVADLVLGRRSSPPPELDPARFGRPGRPATSATR